MRLRQKLFAAILAVMIVMFLLLTIIYFLQGLEGQAARAEIERRVRNAVAAAFEAAASSSRPDRWQRFRDRLVELGVEGEWAVREGDGDVLPPAPGDADGYAFVLEAAGHTLLRSKRTVAIAPVRWFSAVFWALASGTALLLLVVYGLLLRLVLRPVEDLAEASAALSKGTRPAKVHGGGRTDEMGELVRSFNDMAEEVTASREELRARVDEATREYERAQRRLVLEQRLAATGKLAAGIAHEINNPLGGMINAARTLAGREDGLSERGREYLGLIEEGLSRIAAIVERMRAFVRPRPSVGPVDLREAVRSAVAFVRHRLDEEGVTLREEFQPEAVTVTGDAGELGQVFLNLIVNALDAMKGSARRELAVGVEPSGDGASAFVRDTGAGMDAELLANAFDLFYSTKGEGGTGLGLAIAHKIVTDHGGAIELDSSPGEGTRARVRLPLAGGGADERGSDT